MNFRCSIGIFLVLLMCAGPAWAVPETVSMRLTDVTTASFAVVWMTDVAADPSVEVCRDAGMMDCLADAGQIMPMPDAAQPVASAAREKGIMKVRVSGLQPNTNYYVRSVTRDPADFANVGFSAPREVTTASRVLAHRSTADGTTVSLANDQLAMRVYLPPTTSDAAPTLGDLLVVETDVAAYPLSAFVGEGIALPEGLLDLNNLFGLNASSLDLVGGEKMLLRIYRGGTLSTLLHYRRFAADTASGMVGEPVAGFFADFNLDGAVDEVDFGLFKAQYRSLAVDGVFNPDFNLIGTEANGITPQDKIDAQDFARFATEFGNTSVQ